MFITPAFAQGSLFGGGAGGDGETVQGFGVFLRNKRGEGQGYRGEVTRVQARPLRFGAVEADDAQSALRELYGQRQPDVAEAHGADARLARLDTGQQRGQHGALLGHL